jgi:fructose PTS system EIIBC or EIIC component
MNRSDVFMKLVAITSCPTGVAHTYMAAEALKIASEELGYSIKVETQGAVGIENPLTEKDLLEAAVVIIAADKNIDKSRLAKARVYEVSTQQAIKNSKDVITNALKNVAESKKENDLSEDSTSHKGRNIAFYKHLMSGISNAVPFMVAGAVLYLASLYIGGLWTGGENNILETLMLIGENAFLLAVPIMSASIAYSVASTPAIVPGMVSGLIMANFSSGFVAAIVAGFISGYIVWALIRIIRLPEAFKGIVPTFVIPVISTLLIGIISILFLAEPLKFMNNVILSEFTDLNIIIKVIIASILGMMMAYDMGGPINKAAYTIGVISIALGQPSTIMAAVMAAGMIPPLGLAFSVVVQRKLFTVDERKLGKQAFCKALCFITEGAIPFLEKDPKRVLPGIIAGSGFTAALSMIFGCALGVPQGGAFVFLIPGILIRPALYAATIAAGTVLTALLVIISKKRRM